MKKKIINLLVASMTILSLTGCGGEKFTADSLIDGAIDTEHISYKLEYSLDYSAVVDGYIDRVEHTVEADVKSTTSIAYMDIKADAEYDSEVYSYLEKIQTYVELDGKNETSYSMEDEMWTVNAQNVSYDSYIPVLNADMFDDLELEETDDGYEVTGKVEDFEAIIGFDRVIFAEVLEEIDGCDNEMTLAFDGDGVLERFEVDIEPDEDAIYHMGTIGEVTIYEMNFSVEIDSFEESELKIPKEEIDQVLYADDEMNQGMFEDSNVDVISTGKIDGVNYENETLNLGWNCLNEDWTIYMRNYIDSTYNGIEDVSEDAYAETIQNAEMFFDMVAVDNLSETNINVIVEKMSNYDTNYTTEEYANYVEPSLIEMYESYGYSDIEVVITSIEYMGENHPCVQAQYNVGSHMQYQVQSYLSVGNYMVIITGTSNTSLDEVLFGFKGFYFINQ